MLRPSGIREQLLDWLGFFAHQDWAGLREEYAALLQRQQQVSSALQLARRDSEQLEAGLSEQGVAALKAILEKIGAVDNFSGPWQLPAPNPFLRAEAPASNAGLIRGQTSAHRGLRTFAQDRSRSRRERSPMQFSQALPDNSAEGAVYLRWRLDAAPRHQPSIDVWKTACKRCAKTRVRPVSIFPSARRAMNGC